MSILVFLMLAVIQGVLVMHVRSITSSAAQDGALAASRRNASIAEGVAAADAVLQVAAAGPLETWTTSGTRSGDVVRITVNGRVVSVLGFGNVDIAVSRGMRIEEFRPQGSTP